LKKGFWTSKNFLLGGFRGVNFLRLLRAFVVYKKLRQPHCPKDNKPTTPCTVLEPPLRANSKQRLNKGLLYGILIGMKVRGIQFSPALGNIAKNVEFHIEKIDRAVEDKMDLIIFPELSICGYHLKDIVYDTALTPGDEVFNRFRASSKGIDILVGAAVEEYPGIIYNCALYFSKGELLHTHRKVQLPNFGMFEEHMIFKAGNEFRTFKIGDFTAGIIICREILFPVIAYLYYLQDVDFLIGVSNSPHRGITKEGMTSLKLWERMGEVFAVHYHQNYVFVNRCGFEDGMGFGGGSFFAGPGTGIVKKAKYFEDDVLDFEISRETVRRSRITGSYLRDDKPEVIFKELKRILNA
jgi:NAD+ synthase (glutamine-hydrolysing)